MTPGAFLINYPTNKTMIFTPNQYLDVGTHTVSVVVTDGTDSPVYTFLVTVINTPLMIQLWGPEFSQKIVMILSIPINTIKEYTLPIKLTTENMRVVHEIPLPQFATFEFPTYTFTP